VYEARRLLALGVPLIAAQLAALGMGTVDTMMAGHYDRLALAAVALGTNLNVPLFVFSLGLCMAVSPIVAHHRGARGDPRELGPMLRHALLVSLGVGVLWWALLRWAAPLLIGWIHLDAPTQALTLDYLRALSYSAFGFSAWFVLRYGAEGSARPGPVLISGLSALAFNIFLDWVLIYGKGPFPALGAVGCGWATAVSAAGAALVLGGFYFTDPVLRAFGLWDFSHTAKTPAARETWRLGAPMGLILTMEAGLFAVVGLLAGRFGDQTVAAYQVALNFAALLFMIPMGLGLATTVRVGHALGAGDVTRARIRGFVGMRLGVLNAASNAFIMLVGAPLIVVLYTSDAQVATLAAHFLSLAACFQFFDGLQTTAAGALRGLKETRIPLAITLAAYWLLGMPLVWLLAFHTPLAADGLWWGLTASLAAAAAGLSLRFARRIAGIQPPVIVPVV
jgi:MATE family multidrug resistance protein